MTKILTATAPTATVTFGGIAPIPKDTNVKLLVDNPDKPTTAISIKDIDHNIFYGNEEFPSTRVKGAAKIADYVTATVVGTIVYVNQGKTSLSIKDIKPV